MQFGDWIALVGVAVTVVGLGFAAYAIHRSNQNSAAAALLTFYEAVRQAWERFLRATDTNDKEYQFAELANLLEVACALHVKSVFVGVSRELMTEYLDDVGKLLDTSEEAKRQIEQLIHSKTTFKYLRIYLERRKDRG